MIDNNLSIEDFLENADCDANMRSRIKNALGAEGIATLGQLLDKATGVHCLRTTRMQCERYLRGLPGMGIKGSRIMLAELVPVIAADERFIRTPAVVVHLRGALVEAITRLESYHDSHVTQFRQTLAEVDRELRP